MPAMKHRDRLAGALVTALALLFAMVTVAAERPILKAGVFEPPRAAPELSLDASSGGKLSLDRLVKLP